MSVKDLDNEKARELYATPQPTTELCTDPYGFICEKENKEKESEESGENNERENKETDATPLTNANKLEKYWNDHMKGSFEPDDPDLLIHPPSPFSSSIWLSATHKYSVKELVFKGVPIHMKNQVWKWLIAQRVKRKSCKNEKKVADRKSESAKKSPEISNKNEKFKRSKKKEEKHSTHNKIIEDLKFNNSTHNISNKSISNTNLNNNSTLTSNNNGNKPISKYKLLAKTPSGYEYQIHVDIQRTFRNHSLFYTCYSTKQCELFRILVAYSNFNEKVGYCQGMASFTGLLLMYFNETDTFDFLTQILNGLDSLFDSKLSLLPRLMAVQKQIFGSLVPEIFYILKNENIDLCLFIYAWYLTLFSRFDIKFTLRLWDIFIFYGPSVLLPITAGILSYYSGTISKLKNEHLIKFLNSLDQKQLTDEEVEELIQTVRNLIDECDLQYISRTLNFV